MKISTNSIGNYNPIQARRNNQINKTEQAKKIKLDTKISNDEKKFFQKLYPQQKEDINKYHFYNKNGTKNGVSLGSLFDKRG